MIGNVLGSPRTTLAGVLGILLAALGQQVLPAVVQYLGGQPGVVWQLLGLAIGALGPALMADAQKKLADASAPPAPPAVPGFASLGLAFRLAILSLALVLALSGAYFAAAVVGLFGLAVLVGLRQRVVAGTALMLLALAALPARADAPLVYCISGCAKAAPMKLKAGLAEAGEVQVSPTIWIGPSLALNAYVRDSATKSWDGNFTPSFGYGIKWRPANWTATSSLVAGDLFLGGNFLGESPHLDILPQVTLLNAVGFGIGPRFRFASGPGTSDSLSWLFAVRISTALGSP